MVQYASVRDSFLVAYDFSLGSPVQIEGKHGQYLLCDELRNDVFFVPYQGMNNIWVVEQDKIYREFFYLKMVLPRMNHTQFLGAPNHDGQMFLYTSKSRFTRWRVDNIDETHVHFQYCGDHFTKNQIEIVIARYKEDIEWVRAYTDIATIYNKGDADLPESDFCVISLPNIGREGHTYLSHMILRYESFAERTVFVQASPFEHNDTILFGIDNFDRMDPVQCLGLQYLASLQIPPAYYIDKYKTVTNYGLVYLCAYMNQNLTNNEFVDKGINDMVELNYQTYPAWGDYTVVEGFLKRAKFPKRIPGEFHHIPYTYSGLFAVDKRVLLGYSIKVYEDLCEELISQCPQGGSNGFILERLWIYLFQNQR